MELKEGSIAFKNFEVLGKVGAGGMGVVYKARHRAMDRVVVLKILAASTSAQSKLRFQNEARILGRLNHPRIASGYDTGLGENGEAYIAMEFIDGITLGEYIRNTKPVNVRETVELFIDIADALFYAHNEGVIHRDIKPGNIMIVREGDHFVPIVLDFGIAIVDDQHLTAAGALIGSPLYMSPEQIGGRDVTQLSDQYSLGCVLFECLTGTPPFVGETAFDTMVMHSEELPVFAEQNLDVVPEELRAIVLKMLAKKPEDRFSDMKDLQGSLEPLVEWLEAPPIDESDSESNSLTDFFTAKKIPVRNLAIISFSLVALAAVYLGYRLNARSIPISYLTHKENISHALKRVEPYADKELIGDTNEEEISADSDGSAGKALFDECVRRKVNTLKFPKHFSDADLQWFKDFKASEIILRDNRGSKNPLKFFQNSPVHSLSLENTLITDLSPLKEYRKLRRLTLTGMALDDSALLALLSLKQNLRNLSLSGCTHLTDQGLRNLNGLDLVELDLSMTHIEDLSILRQFKYLKTLYLSSSKLTDDKIDCLSELKSLRVLKVDGTAITEAGLEKLRRVKTLEALFLLDDDALKAHAENRINDSADQIYNFEKLTNAAVLRFSKSMPMCSIDKRPYPLQDSMNLAESLVKREAFDKAYVLFEQCYQASVKPQAPLAVTCLIGLSDCLVEKDLNAARAKLEQGRQILQSYGDNNGMIMVLRKLGQLDLREQKWKENLEIQKELQSILTIYRHDPQIWRNCLFNQAISYRELGDYKTAQELFTICLGLDKNDPKNRGLVLLNLALTAEKRGDSAREVESMARAAIAGLPISFIKEGSQVHHRFLDGRVNSLGLLGRTLVRQKKLNEAIKKFEEAHELCVRNKGNPFMAEKLTRHIEKTRRQQAKSSSSAG